MGAARAATSTDGSTGELKAARRPLDPVGVWLQGEVQGGRLQAAPTNEQLSVVARILLDANGGHRNRNGALRLVSKTSTAPIEPRSVLARLTGDEKRHLVKKLHPRRLAAD